MRTFILLLLLTPLARHASGQINAITETGEEVTLYEDGTWVYNDAIQEEEEAYDIPVNPTAFEKGKWSTFLVKSKKTDVGVWIDPKAWNFSKAAINDDAEYQFVSKEHDLYGLLIVERAPIPIQTLRDIAIQNARSASTDFKIVNEEFRTVNGRDSVLMMQFSGVIQGLDFTYFSYYLSGDEGAAQLITYTYSGLFEETTEDMEALLNGLTGL